MSFSHGDIELNKDDVFLGGNSDEKVDGLQVLNVSCSSVDHVVVDNVMDFDAGRVLMAVDNQRVDVKNESSVVELGCVGKDNGVRGNGLHGGGISEKVRGLGGCEKGKVSDISVCNVDDSLNVLCGGGVYAGHGAGEEGEEVRVVEVSLDGVGGSGNASQRLGEKFKGEKRGRELFDVDIVHAHTLKRGNGAVVGGARSFFLGVDNTVGQSTDGYYDVGVKLADCDNIGSLENPMKQADNRDRTIQSDALRLTASEQVVPYHTGDMNAIFPALKPELCMSDLVWGKVRSHPWWPGQIFDSSAASEKAKKYYKRDCYLVGYFGDKSFSWSNVTEMKPFWENFVPLEKQSDSLVFRHAVDCALAEISRRIQSGLACSCIPEDIYVGIQSQEIDNSGICLELNRKDCRDNVPGVASFEPSQLIRYMTTLAKSPLHEVGILERLTAHAQIMAFFRWYNLQFPQLQVSDWLMENDADALVGDSSLSDDIMKDVTQDVKLSKQVLPISTNLSDKNGTSSKHKKIIQDGIGSTRKVKRLSVLMADNLFDVPVVEVETASIISSRPRKRSMVIISRTEGKGKRVKSRFGNSLSTPVETNDSTTKGPMAKESTSPQQMLSQLHLAARNPFEGYNLLVPVSNFFTDFRNSNCLEYMSSPDHEIGKLSPRPELDTETSELECRDSYWTDRIIQRIPAVQPPFEQFTGKEDSALLNVGMQSSKESFEPTALTLKFTDFVSIPSEAYLNEVFSGFGPIIESQTEVLRKSTSAKVVFSRRADAEKAFSSSGKYILFGPSLISYRLKYLSSIKSTAHGTK